MFSQKNELYIFFIWSYIHEIEINILVQSFNTEQILFRLIYLYIALYIRT